MANSREELVQQLNEKQAVRGTNSETRELLGFLDTTIRTLGKEIDTLQQRVAELEEEVNGDEQQNRAWYSERSP
jgi:predicted  nucleic acid-binding Zn-ribbon protein